MDISKVLIADPDKNSFDKWYADISRVMPDLEIFTLSCTAEEIIQAMPTSRPDILFMVPEIQGADNPDFKRKLWFNTHGCVRVAVTDSSDPAVFLSYMEQGFNTILKKEYSPDELDECIESARRIYRSLHEDAAYRMHRQISRQMFFRLAVPYLQKGTDLKQLNRDFVTLFREGEFLSVLIRIESDKGHPLMPGEDLNIRFKVSDIVKSVFRGTTFDVLVDYRENGMRILLNYPDASHDDIMQRLYLLYEQICELPEAEYDTVVSLNVGRPVTDASEIRRSISDTYIVDWGRFGQKREGLHFYKESLPSAEPVGKKLSELAETGRKAIAVLDKTAFAKCIEELFKLPQEQLGRAETYEWLQHITDYFFEMHRSTIDTFDDTSLQEKNIRSLNVGVSSWTAFKSGYIAAITGLMDSINRHADNEYSRPVRYAMRYIEENYGADITVDKIAGQIYMSPAYFSALFKKETGINFTQYLTQYRINMAKEILEHTDKNVQEIAGELGFHDQRYFSKVFQKYVGKTPTEFRKLKFGHK